MEELFSVYISLCVTVLFSMTSDGSWQSEAYSETTIIPPLIGSTLHLKPGTGNYMDLFCSVSDQPQKCGTLSFHTFAFNLTCNEGYIPDRIDGSSIFTFYMNGSWTPSMPQCKRFCKPLKSHRVDIRCHYAGKNIDCNNPLPVGTEATGRCKLGYLLTKEADDATIMCKESGQWSQDLVDCVTIPCGRKNSTGSVSPWLVTIKRDDQVKCSGTLISDHIVITGAACVYSDKYRRVATLHTFQVTVGNYSTRVRQIYIHPYYFAAETNFAFNIALMDLETSIPYTPACIDWDLELQISPGQRGTVAARDSTDILNYIQFEYVDYVNCVPMLATDHRRYLTGCKLCIKPTNDTNTTDNVFGNGLVFELNGVHYLKGVPIRWTYTGKENIYLATSLSDVGLLHWLHETKQSIDAVHNHK